MSNISTSSSPHSECCQRYTHRKALLAQPQLAASSRPRSWPHRPTHRRASVLPSRNLFRFNRIHRGCAIRTPLFHRLPNHARSHNDSSAPSAPVRKESSAGIGATPHTRANTASAISHRVCRRSKLSARQRYPAHGRIPALSPGASRSRSSPRCVRWSEWVRQSETRWASARSASWAASIGSASRPGSGVTDCSRRICGRRACCRSQPPIRKGTVFPSVDRTRRQAKAPRGIRDQGLHFAGRSLGAQPLGNRDQPKRPEM